MAAMQKQPPSDAAKQAAAKAQYEANQRAAAKSRFEQRASRSKPQPSPSTTSKPSSNPIDQAINGIKNFLSGGKDSATSQLTNPIDSRLDRAEGMLKRAEGLSGTWNANFEEIQEMITKNLPIIGVVVAAGLVLFFVLKR